MQKKLYKDPGSENMDLLNLRVKDFTLSALFNGVEGNEIANGWNYTLGMAEGSNGQGGATYTRNVFPDTYFDA